MLKGSAPRRSRLCYGAVRVSKRSPGGLRMRNSIRFRCLAFLFCGIALAAAYNKSRTEAMMMDTASRFLDSLTPEQRAGTLLDFDGNLRTMWHYYPERGFKDE